MRTIRWKSAVATTAVVLAMVSVGTSTQATATETIELSSGQAAYGATDPNTQFTQNGGATWQGAYVVAPHPAYSVLAGTKYVSMSPNGTGAPNSTVRYRTTFDLPAGFGNPSISVRVHADNAATVYLNGTSIGAQPQAQIFENFQDPAESYSSSDPALFQAGSNTLAFDLRNFGDPSGLDYSALVSFQRNAGPDCSGVSASVTELWPPNHEMREVSVAGASDPDGDVVSMSVTGVTQDETVAGPGVSHAPDASVGDDVTLLRAERDGGGDGRVYRIGFEATDTSGATCSGTAIVGVPHDRSGAAAVDSGDSYDSTSG